jgi:ribosome maturation factor RimP
VDRPLILPRHWRRNVGRLVTVNGLTGRVTAADEQGIVLDDREIAHADLGPGKVQIEFKRMDEAHFDDDELSDDDEDEREGGE